MEQRSDEWFSARLGKITASRVADVMAKTRSGPAASRKNYMMELLCQRLTGHREEGYTSAAMQRGVDLEPMARAAYEVETGCTVEEQGFVLHPKYDEIGASPDGLVPDYGLIEIKVPNTAQHVEVIRTSNMDKRYWWQMQMQMACTETSRCDFVSFDDRLPESLQLIIVPVDRDDQAVSEMLDECLEFLGELKALEDQMRERMEAS